MAGKQSIGSTIFVSTLLFIITLSLLQIEEVKWVEVIICLLVAMTAAGTVHRVCVTTCLIFSLVETYALSQLSKKTYGEVAVGGKYKRF